MSRSPHEVIYDELSAIAPTIFAEIVGAVNENFDVAERRLPPAPHHAADSTGTLDDALRHVARLLNLAYHFGESVKDVRMA